MPQPRLHTARYLGHYSNRSRGLRQKGRNTALDTTLSARDEPDEATSAERRARRRAWAQLRCR